jgi:hypothetical protein
MTIIDVTTAKRGQMFQFDGTEGVRVVPKESSCSKRAKSIRYYGSCPFLTTSGTSLVRRPISQVIYAVASDLLVSSPFEKLRMSVNDICAFFLPPIAVGLY